MSTCVPLVEGCDLDALRATRAKALGTSEMRASTVLGVRTLVSPELSVEIDLLACRPWWLVLRLRTHPLHEGVVCQAKQRSWVGGGGRGKTETGFVLSRVGNLNTVLNIHD